MPFEIDSEALDSPNLKVLDIQHPPTKSIPHMEFPRMIYLHPVDKTKEHRTKIVHSKTELEAATKQGWKLAAHVPEAPPDAEIEAGEFEIEPEAEEEPKGRRSSGVRHNGREVA